MITILLTIILTGFTVAVIQLLWWVPKNGFSFFGTCVNHFGEAYSCSVMDWVARGLFSPFAWPAVLVIALICFAISRCIAAALKRQKSKNDSGDIPLRK